MKKYLIIMMMLAFSALPLSLRAEESGTFKKYNPDGMKYEFARSYIASLGYLNSVDQRWKKSAELKKKNSQDKFIAWNIERLIYDNMDIRVAKNYMTKYFRTNNLLMRKVTDTYVFACDQILEVNLQEREAWENLKRSREAEEFDADQEKAFVAQQESLAERRKEAMKGIVASSVLMTKVLLSENTREKDVKKRLALSMEQREKLVAKLDSYAKDNLDWSLKPGQTLVQAAEASVREILEDSFYLSADE
jgi:hypothetical protein